MKLKKKHRPMTFLEWGASTGAVVAASKVDHDVVQRVADKVDDDQMEVARAISAAYHAYICAHILNIVEKKS